tara:strand:- start:700 stop:861 length:162 start_codon:yes stop_codon:yes gene_type:complete
VKNIDKIKHSSIIYYNIIHYIKRGIELESCMGQLINSAAAVFELLLLPNGSVV